MTSASPLDQELAVVDLETTGANPAHDRVTEVAIVRLSGGEVVDEWSTLVNPGVSIPPAIQALTGITNHMVAASPAFADIAESVYERLDGQVFVAHNARFDYGFLRNEFARTGLRFQPPQLCTVKLSRRLFPQERRHNLDSLIARHGLACDGRHRALGDTRALVQFLAAVRREANAAAVDEAVRALLMRPSLPAQLPPDLPESLPEGPGVYVFYGENDLPLYIGKSVRLRARVLAHFSADHRGGGDMRLAQQVRHVEWIETAGELGALLLEAQLVKERRPVHNRQLRAHQHFHAFALSENGDCELRLVECAGDDHPPLDALHGLFRSKRQALEALRGLAAGHGLCHKLLGLEAGAGPCFAHQLKRCRGACVGKESRLHHRLRLMAALAPLKLATWPYAGRIGMRESGEERVEVHVLDAWRYLGSARTEADLAELRAAPLPAFDLDTYKILTRYLKNAGSGLEVMSLG